MEEVTGVYEWSYAGGNFLIHLRGNGVMYCQSYPAAATWSYADGTLEINWKKFGSYQLVRTEAGSFEGSVVGNASKWRKMRFLRPFTEFERVVFGNGGGSVWEMTWEKGSVGEIEFRVDGLNHFVSNNFPAHSHWTMDGESGQINLDWGKYGSYELRMNADGLSMEGNKAGQPQNWRRVTFVRGLGADSLDSVPSHDHSHSHAHGEGCSHKHHDGECDHKHHHDGECDHKHHHHEDGECDHKHHHDGECDHKHDDGCGHEH